VDANRALGLPDDCREYSAVRHILADLGVRSVRLMTNNPRKLQELAGLGITVTGRIPCQVGLWDARTRRRRGNMREPLHRRCRFSPAPIAPPPS
jgi:GTP cyclohydrolase II